MFFIFSACLFIFLSLFFFIKKKKDSQKTISSTNLSLQIEQSDDFKLKELKRFISKAQYLENVEKLGEQTVLQLAEISEKYNQFQEILKKKFNIGEITYTRYFSASHKAYIVILDHLNYVTTLLNSANTFKPHSLDIDLDKNQKKNMYDEQMKKAQETLSQSAKAITQFSQVSTALSLIKTNESESSDQIESVIGELTDLAHRAEKYSISFDNKY